MAFDPDHHEKEEFETAMYGLSQFILQWNWAEHNFNVLLWTMAGDFQTGAQYTATLSNQARAELIKEIAQKKLRDPSDLEIVQFCVDAFLRLNSNAQSPVKIRSTSCFTLGVKLFE